MRKIFLILLLLLGNLAIASDCTPYYDYDENKVMKGNITYIKNYLRCNVREVTELSEHFQYEDADNIWAHIDFLMEHFNGKGDLISKNLDVAILKQRVLYEIGLLTRGTVVAVGPDYYYKKDSYYKWHDYYNYVFEKYSYLKNLKEKDRYDLLKQVYTQMAYLGEKNLFANSYYFNTYVIHLMAIVNNCANNDDKNSQLKKVISFYFKYHDEDIDIYMMIENLSKEVNKS